MATLRHLLVDPVNECDYHLVSRCVRRAFLCGVDEHDDRDYSHRRAWLVDRMGHLAPCFAVDVYAYTVLSNHFHLVLRHDPLAHRAWTDEEVAWRWFEAFPPAARGTAAEELKPERRELMLGEPVVVAAYIGGMQDTHAPAMLKQHLAGIRMMFDWLVVGHVVETNPATAVRGSRHVVEVGKATKEARQLLDSINVGTGDRAMIALMVSDFARVSAGAALRIPGYYTQGKRSYLRLHEKGGSYNQVQVLAHHLVQEDIDAYLEAAGVHGEPDSPLFRASAQGKGNGLAERGMRRESVWGMVKRRAAKAALPYAINPHSFRATGITEYMRNGGDVGTARALPVMSRRARRSCTTGSKRTCHSTRSSGSASEARKEGMQQTKFEKAERKAK